MTIMLKIEVLSQENLECHRFGDVILLINRESLVMMQFQHHHLGASCKL